MGACPLFPVGAGRDSSIPLLSSAPTSPMPSTAVRFVVSALLGACFALAQSNSSVLCVAGQCLEGFSDTTSA